MNIEVLTLFPEMFGPVLAASMLGRAVERGLLEVTLTDLRPFGLGKHHSTDDTPSGGGSGMVMRADPIVAALEQAVAERGPARTILMSPAGVPLDQAGVRRLARYPRLVLVCGRYEGVDDRVASFVDEELSIGDYVLTGGELAAMIVIDSVTRRLPGVLGNSSSPVDESFEDGLLEHPHYTRPTDFRGHLIPDALLSGNHERIRRWRRRESLLRTRARRPDLFARLQLTDEDRRLLAGEQP